MSAKKWGETRPSDRHVSTRRGSSLFHQPPRTRSWRSFSTTTSSNDFTSVLRWYETADHWSTSARSSSVGIAVDQHREANRHPEFARWVSLEQRSAIDGTARR